MEMEKKEIEIHVLAFMFYIFNARNALNGRNFSIQSNLSKGHENADTSFHYPLLPPLDKQQVHTVVPPFFYFIVTSSSALVGWIATQESKSRLRAPILTATPKPCSISALPRPRMCRPTMRSSEPAQTSL